MKRTMTECNVPGAPNRRQFLIACSALAALPVTLSAAPAMAATASFSVIDGNAKVDVFHTRNNGVRCTVYVRDNARSPWVAAGSGYHVLVRQRGSSGRFDEETTNASGDTRHTANTYTSGMRLDVSVSGLVSSGSGAL